MKGQKTYLQPMEMVLNAIHDIGALQKGQVTICDTPRGLVGYRITMYGEELEYRFTVINIGNGCSRVTIELTVTIAARHASRLVAAENEPEAAHFQNAAARHASRMQT